MFHTQKIRIVLYSTVRRIKVLKKCKGWLKVVASKLSKVLPLNQQAVIS